jgi:ATP-binding cassette subfamily B protein
VFPFLKPHLFLIAIVTILAFAANGLSLYFPKKMGEYIDAYSAGSFSASNAWFVVGGIALIVLVLSFIQSAVASYASEKISFELRNKLVGVLKNRSFETMRGARAGHLVTVTTSDVDAIKNFVVNGLPSMLMAIVTLIGVTVFLVIINLKLALLTLTILPVIFIIFGFVFSKLGPLFGATQSNLDNINKTINESIVSSALVRVLNSMHVEMSKFDVVNKKGAELGKTLVTYFASLIPVITLLSNVAVLVVLWFGGREVIAGNLSLGEMSAFFAYTSVFVWPFFILSFGSTLVSRAMVSAKRINEVLHEQNVYSKDEGATGEVKGEVVFKNVFLCYGNTPVLKDISFSIKSGQRTAIIGPTGAGKTELFYLLTGLATPTSGEISIDGRPLSKWNQSNLLSQIGLVFQDSIVFNTSFKENVLFKSGANEEVLSKALRVADLDHLVENLSEGLETNVSERGTSLSGGQKQRIMLARALALKPRMLLLDDFTARVDAGTEERILSNIQKEFAGITLISITQKIESIKEYDHIIVLMGGELVAQGKHADLLARSMEYQQIYESQQSIENH